MALTMTACSLLPNGARRVLEVFTSYKAPHLGTFDQRLGDLMGGDLANNPYRDVYDFCNRYSHGEGGESVDVLDARVIHGADPPFHGVHEVR